MSKLLSGQVALVTGGAAGIGRATALAFAAAGVKVVVADLDSAGGEGQRGSAADARRTASDQCDLAGKKFAHLLLLGKSPSANRDGTGPRQSSQGRRKA